MFAARLMDFGVGSSLTSSPHNTKAKRKGEVWGGGGGWGCAFLGVCWKALLLK